MDSYEITLKLADYKDIQKGRISHTGRYATPYPRC